MTREEINASINKVPEIFKERYGLRELDDLTDRPYELVTHEGKEYRYYPDIPGVLVGSKLVAWEAGKPDDCEVDVHDPSHFEQVLRRGCRMQYDDIVGIIRHDAEGLMHVDLELSELVDQDYEKSVPVDGTVIYYDGCGIGFERIKSRKTIAIALFLAGRYKTEHMIPFKDTDPSEWGDYE